MKMDVLVEAALLRHVDGKLEVLLVDESGHGVWELPGGDLFELEDHIDVTEDFGAVFEIPALHHVHEQANIDPEWVDTFGDNRFQPLPAMPTAFNRELKVLVVPMWGFVDEEAAEKIDKALGDKRGNARFFPTDDLPELHFENTEVFIEMLVNNLRTRDN